MRHDCISSANLWWRLWYFTWRLWDAHNHGTGTRLPDCAAKDRIYDDVIRGYTLGLKARWGVAKARVSERATDDAMR